MTESALLKQIQVAASRAGARLFRNTVAFGYIGSRTRRNADGSITIYDPRPIHAGLCVGSSDLIGWDAAGRFLAIEGKTGRVRVTTEQAQFIRAVNAAGGVGLVAHSPADVLSALKRNPDAGGSAGVILSEQSEPHQGK